MSHVRATHLIEVHTARLLPGVDPEAFRALNAARMPAMRKFHGLLRRELVHDPATGLWTDILHWRSREAREESLAAMMADPDLHAFMAKLDPATMQVLTLGDAVDLDAPGQQG